MVQEVAAAAAAEEEAVTVRAEEARVLEQEQEQEQGDCGSLRNCVELLEWSLVVSKPAPSLLVQYNALLHRDHLEYTSVS